MIITELKPIQDIVDSLKNYSKIFLLGCGECATTCKTGGEPELLKMKQDLEAAGKVVSGMCIPSAPCVAAKLKTELAKNMEALRESDAVLVLACGLGAQSFKDNDRFDLTVLPACNSMFGAVMDSRGNFYEKCSMCGECVLDVTGGICPVTLCPKGLLNGPCGGMDKGKCEVDKDKDCAWVLIYKELEKKKKLELLKEIRRPKDFKKSGKPHKLMMK
ncbi:MAG: 5,10-methylenetetrahydrofolate reductase [Candidatus Omnitrophica bacterium CG08_land_8_20_14_0_20_41_16]|uniref:5,10-methylenetetrahydrofolate reductase n=1 Tax=Candidatus Sherwoodlollariibacterium unditelluris TaxID=1974757 RepID=A0A2G9YIL5_9BACT|nr:MAG: 5,10-methylenetetrahydrofolate reductase [Candidatus Omnitrophica bacterium CG23_combo_of_CG06-09_8_20_14_all_41_10]PIS33509.1 MAG: 5,10-methylenetetrahydrofolate reductase [Candidatus Omnitrophica bacterium CG08_land_8_20_14_0_20_41_16]